MSAGIKLISKPNNLTSRIRALADQLQSEKFYSQLASAAKTAIVSRTLQGTDEHGRPFTPYVARPAYIPVRNRPAGYPKPGGGIETKGKRSVLFLTGWQGYKLSVGRPAWPQLSMSNKMLGSITWRATRTDATLFFADAFSQAKAHGHQFGTNNLPKRAFFGLGDAKSAQDVLEQAREQLVGYLKSEGLA